MLLQKHHALGIGIIVILDVLTTLDSLVYGAFSLCFGVMVKGSVACWWCVLVGVVIGLCMFSLATLCHKPLSEHKIVPRAPF